MKYIKIIFITIVTCIISIFSFSISYSNDLYKIINNIPDVEKEVIIDHADRYSVTIERLECTLTDKTDHIDWKSGDKALLVIYYSRVYDNDIDEYFHRNSYTITHYNIGLCPYSNCTYRELIKLKSFKCE